MALKEFKRTADESYWEDLWDSIDINEELVYNKYSPLFDIFKKYLPKDGVILEGGCGNGQWVEVLRQEGYDVLGLDYADKTIARIEKIFSKCNFVVGDLTKLNYSDNYFAGHISRGVIEHFVRGPKKINKEIHRTLKPGGILVLSTPYYNIIKKMKYGRSNKRGKGDFYQYHYTKKELTSFFKNDYELKNIYYINPLKTLRDETIFKKVLTSSKKKRTSSKKSKIPKNEPKSKRSLLQKIAQIVERNPLFARIAGHSICLVLVKK